MPTQFIAEVSSIIELHLDLEGEEFATGCCPLPTRIQDVIEPNKGDYASDGNCDKQPVPRELPDCDWRADPNGGLQRPSYRHHNFRESQAQPI